MSSSFGVFSFRLKNAAKTCFSQINLPFHDNETKKRDACLSNHHGMNKKLPNIDIASGVTIEFLRQRKTLLSKTENIIMARRGKNGGQ